MQGGQVSMHRPSTLTGQVPNAALLCFLLPALIHMTSCSGLVTAVHLTHVGGTGRAAALGASHPWHVNVPNAPCLYTRRQAGKGGMLVVPTFDPGPHSAVRL